MASLQTPPRPVPGIWPQTPAVRPPPPAPSFHSSTSQIGQATQPSLMNPPSSLLNTRPSEPPTQTTPRPPEALKPPERAARSINEALAGDTRFPELDSYLSQGFSSDYDLQSSAQWAPFQKVRMYNIPDQIFEQYNHAQVSTSMGLFAELHHAWVAIDNALYMWDYTANNPELLGFEGQPNSITAVKLAVPRVGVFLPTIKNVIVLATTSEVLLLGLGTESGPGGVSTLSLFQTGIAVSVKGLDVSVIASSPLTGRIFFGGRTENEVYELKYQQEEGWFSNRSTKVCHTSSLLGSFAVVPFGPKRLECVEQMVVDDSRSLLYTLSSQSAIRLFHMKSDGSLPLLVTKPAADIYSNVGHIISQNETLNPRIRIVSISPISHAEASRYHLVATTATGYRIYLSATSSGYWSSVSGTSSVPVSMQAQHVKTPPFNSTAPPQPHNYQGQQLIEPTSNVHRQINTLVQTRSAQRYSPGYFFCFTTKDANSPTDTLFISSPDAARLKMPPEAGQPNRLSESAIWLSLGSRAEDIGMCTPYSAPTNTPAGYGNDLAVQFDGPAPEIAVLTNTGVHIIRRRRLVDIFAALIQQGGGIEGFQGEVNGFIRTYGRTETLATALAVACGQGSDVSQDARSARINDPEVLEVARKTFIDYGGKPSYNQNLMADKSTPAIDTIKPSPRYTAIAVYVSRLLRSTWKTVIAKEDRAPTGYSILPSVTLQKLRNVQEDLSSLQRFFHVNKTFIKGLSGPDDLSRSDNKSDEVAMQGEHRALHSIVKFVSDTIEGISFVLVLFDERVAEIVPLLPEQSRPQFLKLTFEELFSMQRGHELAKELVKAIVNRNIAKGSNVETVAEALRRKCGRFCSPEDVVIFKAQEQLKRAAEAGNNAEFARNLLNESLKLFMEVAESLPQDYLTSAVQQFIALQFFAGAISLVLKVAQGLDKGNEALSWMADGRPEPDMRKVKFEQRTRCYDLIHDVINAVDKSMEHGPTFFDGRPTPTATRRMEAYDVISRSKDEVFLTNLYDWYLKQGWYDRLLATDSTFIITYLQAKSEEDVAHADLLWKYYGQTNQFYDAARIQLRLARSTFSLTLDRRIEYLSRARANASTYTQGGNRKTKQRLLQDISDLLDVANIQDEVLQRFKDEPRLDPAKRKELLAKADGEILELSYIFNEWVDLAGYFDIALLIYQVADFRDTSKIKQTWQQLFQATHDATLAQEEGPQPFEAIADLTRSLGGRLRLSETVFPVHTLVLILEKYTYDHQRDVAPPHWVVDIFMDLQVAYERLFDVLEIMFHSQEPPFIGVHRGALADDIVYVVGKWMRDTSKGGAVMFDSEAGASRVDQMMQALLRAGRSAGVDERNMQGCRAIREGIAQVLG